MAGCNLRNDHDGDDEGVIGSSQGHVAGALGRLGSLEC